jgi:hypothetical protein
MTSQNGSLRPGFFGLKDWRRFAPLALVLMPVVFNLVVLRPQLVPAQNLNDAVVHTQMIRWAERRVAEGHLPLDGWYPNLSMGSSRFHHAQSVPHVITGYLGRVVGADVAYRWTLYLLMATWPITVFWGMRLLGWGRWAAASAALVSPLAVSAPGLGHEYGSYVWHGYGVWSQLWGMWTLPLAWGLSWRAVSRGEGYASAALAVAATVCFHFIAGYLALLAVAAWVVVTPAGIWRRVRRAVVVGGGALLIASFVLVPLIVDARWTNQSPVLRGTVFRDSFGASTILGWLVRGEIFDHGRLAVLSVLVAAGLWRCGQRFLRDERGRALLAVSGLSLVLFFGRPTLGPLLELLPGGDDIFLRRMIMGVHLGGVMIAGVGMAWLGDRVARLVHRVRPSVHPAVATGIGAAVLLGSLAPAWVERVAYSARGADLVEAQSAADRSDGEDASALIRQAVDRQDGRLFGGMRGRWGDGYTVGHVPMYAVLGNHDADALGFTFRTPTGPGAEDIEVRFDEANVAHYGLFNVRYVLLPAEQRPLVKARLIGERGRHRLWETEAEGYLGVVDTISPIAADRTSLGIQMRQFLSSALPEQRLHPLVDYEGEGAPSPTRVSVGEADVPPGVVQAQIGAPDRGVFAGRVLLHRSAVVMLRSTFDPRWEASVDGAPSPTFMVAPNFVGVAVPPGSHDVGFRYAPYPYYGPLLLLGLLTLVTLALVPAVVRRRGRRPRPVRGGARRTSTDASRPPRRR